jgi:threonyl-tRNA synthetase
MTTAGLRVEVDRTDETVGEKIRRALSAKHPAVLVVGDADVADRTAGYRRYGKEEDRRGVPVDEIVAELVSEARPPSETV